MTKIRVKTDEATGLFYRPYTIDEVVVKDIELYSKLFKHVKDRVVLDIGGNIGAFAYGALEGGCKKVYSFEEGPSNIKMYNGQKLKNVKLIEKGVTNKNFKKILEKAKPQVIRIDQYNVEYDIDFKLIPQSVKAIAINIHLLPDYNRKKGKKLLEYLKEEFTELTQAKVSKTNWTTLFIGIRK